MSANLVIDLPQTTNFFPSINNVSGSNVAVGAIVDLLNSDAYCNVFIVAGGGISGVIPVTVQTSDSTASGSFTVPMSGLAQAPQSITGQGFTLSGVFWANSGLYASGNQSPFNGLVDGAPAFCSGGIQFATFQRNTRYARLVTFSGNEGSIYTAGFISQKLETGSGYGFSWSPQSGTGINV